MRNRRRRRKSPRIERLARHRKLLAEPLEPRWLLATFAGTESAVDDVSVSGYAEAPAEFDATDLELLELTTDESSVREDAGTLTGTLSRGTAGIGFSLTVNLVSDDTTEITVPSQVVIPADQASVDFDITVVNDKLLDGAQDALVTASALGYQDAQVQLLVTDAASLSIVVAFGEISEFGGTTTATISRDNTDIDESLVVALSVDDDTEVSIPAEVTIEADESFATFQITAVDDDLLDGTQILDVVAQAAGYLDGSIQISVTDYEELLVVPADASISENGGVTTVRIERPNSDLESALTVSLHVSDPALVSIPSHVEIAAEEAAATVQLEALDDDVDAEYLPVVITATATGFVDGNESVEVTNDDEAGITVSVISGNTTEAGGAATFSVVLDSEPTAEVTIPLGTSDDTEGVVSDDTLTFLPADWDTAQIVTVTGVDDDIDDGDVAFLAVVAAASSDDENYDESDADDVAVTNLDDDTAGITVTGISGDTSEAGGGASFSIVLNSEPTNDVTIALGSSDTTEGNPSPQTVTFSPADWNTARFVTVFGVDDDEDDGDVDYTIQTASAASEDDNYDGLDPDDVPVTNTDDDEAGITVSAISGNTSESGASASFLIVLDSEPTSNVTIALSSSDTSEGDVTPQALTFTSENWNTPQLASVMGVDDDVDDGDIAYFIQVAPANSSDEVYSGLDANDVAVTNTDDDEVGIAVSAISADTKEAGSVAEFSVVLNSEPTADVTISITSGDTSEGSVASDALTFTAANWSVAQLVAVTGVDDDIDDGDIRFTIEVAAASSDDPNYDGIDPADVAATNLDDDTAGITVSPIRGDTTEAGDTTSFTIVLDTEPMGNVAIAVSSSDISEGITSPETVTFTPGDWNVAQLVMVTGIDDDVDDGDVSYTVVIGAAASDDDAYDGLDPSDLSLFNLNDDTAGITVSQVSGNTTEAGQTATFTIVLDTEPMADVTVSLTSSDSTEGTVPDSLTFTPYDWDTPHVVTVTGVDDMVDDGDVPFWVVTEPASSGDSTYNGMEAADAGLTNLDDDTAGVTISVTDDETSESGDTASFSLVLNSQPTSVVRIDIMSTDLSEGLGTPESVFFTPEDWDTPQVVTVTGVDDDIDDGDVEYMVVTVVTAIADPIYNGFLAGDVTLRNLNDDTAAIFVSSVSGDTSETGTEATFSIVLGSEPAAEVTLGLSSGDDTEGTLAVEAVTFTPGDWDAPQMVTVTGVDDALDDGDIVFEIMTAAAASLDYDYDGMDPDNVTVTNLDDQLDGLTWQNPIHPCDVNNDGSITSEDLLVLIADINANDSRQLPPSVPPHVPPPFLDPSGDGELTPSDVLIVIQYLNENGPGPAVPVGLSDSGNGSSPGGPGLPAGEGEPNASLSTSAVARSQLIAPPVIANLEVPSETYYSLRLPGRTDTQSRELEQPPSVLVGPNLVLMQGVDPTASNQPPFSELTVDVRHGVDDVMSEADQEEDDRVCLVDLEDTLSDIADDVSGIWALS